VRKENAYIPADISQACAIGKKKIADALIHGKAIRIEGGNYRI